MYKFLTLSIFAMLFFTSCNDEGVLSPSQEITSIPILDVYIEEGQYLKLLTNKTNNTTVSAEIYYNGKRYEGNVRSSGSGSRYHPRWGFKFEIAKGEQIEGLDAFNLSSQVFDKTLLKTAIVTQLYSRLGLLTNRTQHVFLRINQQDIGLYPMNERVEEPFFAKRGLSVYELYKLSFETQFRITESYVPEFTIDKEIPKDDEYHNLIEFFTSFDTMAIINAPKSLNKYLDVENYLRYHALTSVLANYDAFTNNFFFYKSAPDKPFQIIPWDFDKSFTEDTDIVLYGDNGIIEFMLQNPELKSRYKEILKQILNEHFTEAVLYPMIEYYAGRIEEAYNLDPYLGKYKRYDFLTEVDNLKDYISARRSFLLAEIDDF